VSDPDPNGGSKVRALLFGPGSDALFKTVVTALLALLGFFGVRTLNLLDETARTLRTLEISIAAHVGTLASLQDRVGRIESRIDKQDTALDELRRRIYQIPSPDPVRR